VCGAPQIVAPTLQITSIHTTMAEVISAANTALIGRLNMNMTRSCSDNG
jgi:hypothetical protein